MLTTSDFYISPEYFIDAIPALMKATVFSSILADTIQEYSQKFDGGSAKAVFTVDRDLVSDTSTIGDTGGAGADDNRYSENEIDLTIAEYGNFEEKISGKARLQTYDQATAKVFRFLVGSAMKTFDDLFAETALEGGTATDTDGGAENTQWHVLNPDGSHDPQDTLTTNDVRDAVLKIENETQPFADGLFRVVIHHHLIHDIMEEVDANSLAFADYSKYRQAGMSIPAEFAYNEIGVFAGCLWKKTYSAKHVITDGASGGTADAYKTLVFGQNYVGGVFVPTENLSFADNGLSERYPISRYIELRMGPNTADHHYRGIRVVPYFAGGTTIIKKAAGIFYVSTSDYSEPGYSA